MVMSNKNRHHQNHSKQPFKHRKQDKICMLYPYFSFVLFPLFDYFCDI